MLSYPYRAAREQYGVSLKRARPHWERLLGAYLPPSRGIPCKSVC